MLFPDRLSSSCYLSLLLLLPPLTPLSNKRSMCATVLTHICCMLMGLQLGVFAEIWCNIHFRISVCAQSEIYSASKAVFYSDSLIKLSDSSFKGQKASDGYHFCHILLKLFMLCTLRSFIYVSWLFHSV